MRKYTMGQIGETVYELLSQLPIEEYSKQEAIFWRFKELLEEREG